MTIRDFINKQPYIYTWLSNFSRESSITYIPSFARRSNQPELSALAICHAAAFATSSPRFCGCHGCTHISSSGQSSSWSSTSAAAAAAAVLYLRNSWPMGWLMWRRSETFQPLKRQPVTSCNCCCYQLIYFMSATGLEHFPWHANVFLHIVILLQVVQRCCLFPIKLD